MAILRRISAALSGCAVVLLLAAFQLPQEPNAHYYRPGDVVTNSNFVQDGRPVVMHCGDAGFYYNSFVRHENGYIYEPVAVDSYWMASPDGENYFCMMRSVKQ